VLIAGLGAPYALVAAGGLHFAPAYDQGALNPGCMPLFVALIAAIVLGQKFSTTRKLGLSLILAGAVIIVGWHAVAWSTSRTFGDALFLFAAFLSACFTVVMQQAQLEPLHAAALVSTGSLVIYLPIYLALYGTRLAQLPLAEITVQAIFQGVLVTIVSLLLYGRAVAILGASGGAAFGALVPALSALFAIPLLGEWPSEPDWVAMYRPRFRGHRVDGNRVRQDSGGDSEIAPPTEIADPGGIVWLDREARPAHAAFRRVPRARTAAGV